MIFISSSRIAVLITILTWAVAVPVCSLAQESPFAAVARTTFADLLKIPVTDPDVSVTVRTVKEEDGLIIEDIVWESLDNEHPIAYFIHGAKSNGRLPAVIYLPGSGGSRESECAKTFGMGQWTSATGRTGMRFLGAARELARRGYVTLSLTPRGLDIRSHNKDQSKLSTDEDAKDLLIRGRTLMGAEVYEIRQAITYLQQRKDVDPNKIGMSGLSFGGITTFYTWLMDHRLAAAAPICGSVGSVDIFSRLGQRSYHGFYWWIPDMLTKGDQADFAAAMAPRPLMLWAPLDDIAMPKQGVDRFIQVVRPAYQRAGAENAFVVYQRPGVHQLTFEAFELMSQFFDRQLKK